MTGTTDTAHLTACTAAQCSLLLLLLLDAGEPRDSLLDCLFLVISSPLCSSHIHAVDGYEEESTVPKAAVVPAAANANASSISADSDTAVNDSATR